jgi:hypothetical protein
MFLQLNTPKRSRILVTACVFCLLYTLVAFLPATMFELLFCRGPAWLASLYLGATCYGTALSLRSGHVLAVTHACGGSDFFVLVCSMIAWYVMAPGGLGLIGGSTKERYWNIGILEYWNIRLGQGYGGQAARRPNWEGRASARPGHADACPSLSHSKLHHSTIPPFHYSIHVIREACILLFMAWAFVNGVNSMRVVLSFWTRLASEALLPERFDAAVHMVSGVMIFFPALLAVWWFCKTRTKEVLHERES